MPDALQIAIVGPTATGKTAVAVELAERIGAEILSADSMQIWRGMDIGTAKPSAQELSRARFHLIDILDTDASFSVAEFQKRAREAVGDILGRGRAVVMAGGTGLYVKAVIDNPEFPPQADPGVRKALREQLRAVGPEALYAQLEKVDPETASRLEPADRARIVRALEVFRTTGRSISSFHRAKPGLSGQGDWKMFGLKMQPDALCRRIDSRVDAMIQAGLVEEVRALVRQGLEAGSQSARALGYSEVLDYLSGTCTLAEAVEKIKLNTRRYAKRQRTWFRADNRICWLDADTMTSGELAEQIMKAVAADS